jgi:CubicO group peptidase (beta-lactamase class C family)
MAHSYTRFVGLLVTALLWSAVAATAFATEVSDIVSRVGVPSGTRVDIAIFTRDGTCYESDGGPRYHAASITKLFTAVVIMQLRDEGQLSLRDPVSKFVPEFAGSPILVEELLTHSSGLHDRKRANGRNTRAQWDAYIHELSAQRLVRKPKAEWAYADANFNLLGRVIESITGKHFAVAVSERLLVPLGMSASVFDLAKVPESQLVHATDKRGRELAHPWDLAFLASSGLQTDASDLAKFGRAILSVEAEHGASAVLRVETLHEMTAIRAATEWPGISQGYGWQVANYDSTLQWRHAGGEEGFESLFTLYPAEGFGVVVIGNRKDWPRFELAGALANEVRGGTLRRTDNTDCRIAR